MDCKCSGGCLSSPPKLEVRFREKSVPNLHDLSISHVGPEPDQASSPSRFRSWGDSGPTEGGSWFGWIDPGPGTP